MLTLLVPRCRGCTDERTRDLYNNFNVGGLPFTYPPFAGAVFIRFDLFPQPPPVAIWTAVSIARTRLALSGSPPCGCQPSLAKELTTKHVGTCAVYLRHRRLLRNGHQEHRGWVKSNLVLVLLIMIRHRDQGPLSRLSPQGMAAGFKIVPAIFIVSCS